MRPDFAQWRKSSRSAHHGECVEVGWSTSSPSGNQGMCVEVGAAQDVVGVRDSKLGQRSPILVFGRSEWSSFLESLKRC